MSGSGGSGENARAPGVRSGPPAVRCGYGSSLTSPRSLIRSGPGPLLIRRSLRIPQGGCGRRYRAGTGPVSRTGSYLRSAAGRGRFSVPSHGASPRPIRAWRALLPQACGPAAADSRARKAARHRQVRAVALDQAADDARGIKHALDTDRRGQPGSARPCSVILGIAPSLAPKPSATMASALMCAARSEIPARAAISATVAGPSASASKMPIELAANRCFAAMKPERTVGPVGVDTGQWRECRHSDYPLWVLPQAWSPGKGADHNGGYLRGREDSGCSP